jgi:hypothetical protein
MILPNFEGEFHRRVYREHKRCIRNPYPSILPLPQSLPILRMEREAASPLSKIDFILGRAREG